MGNSGKGANLVNTQSCPPVETLLEPRRLWKEHPRFTEVHNGTNHRLHDTAEEAGSGPESGCFQWMQSPKLISDRNHTSINSSIPKDVVDGFIILPTFLTSCLPRPPHLFHLPSHPLRHDSPNPSTPASHIRSNSGSIGPHTAPSSRIPRSCRQKLQNTHRTLAHRLFRQPLQPAPGRPVRDKTPTGLYLYSAAQRLIPEEERAAGTAAWRMIHTSIPVPSHRHIRSSQRQGVLRPQPTSSTRQWRAKAR